MQPATGLVIAAPELATLEIAMHNTSILKLEKIGKYYSRHAHAIASLARNQSIRSQKTRSRKNLGKMLALENLGPASTKFGEWVKAAGLVGKDRCEPILAPPNERRIGQ